MLMDIRLEKMWAVSCYELLVMLLETRIGKMRAVSSCELLVMLLEIRIGKMRAVSCCEFLIGIYFELTCLAGFEDFFKFVAHRKRSSVVFS